MKKLIYFCLGLSFIVNAGYAQVNVVLLHQLVSESESEYDRQTTARTRQAAVSANEAVNKSQMTTLKGTYRDLKSRFHTLGLVISAANVGIEATPVVNSIIDQQQQIFEQCDNNPVLILLAVDSEADLADQANLLVRYCAGLTLSVGDLNQMKASDRKMLFGHVVTELRRINGATRGLLTAIINFNNHMKMQSLNPFSGFINRDKQLVDDIIRNAKAIKQ